MSMQVLRLIESFDMKALNVFVGWLVARNESASYDFLLRVDRSNFTWSIHNHNQMCILSYFSNEVSYDLISHVL